MTDDRNERGRAVWPLVFISIPLLYVASFGPACWISSKTKFGVPKIAGLYQPLAWASAGSNRTGAVLSWYAEIGAAEGYRWDLHPYLKSQHRSTFSIGYRWGWGKLDSPTP
jgi:hypothetical protein